MSGYIKLQEEVINVGLCAFCGLCAGVCPSKNLIMNYETEEPDRVKNCPPKCNLCYEVCPGKDIPMPDLERFVFDRERNTDEEAIGIYQGCVAAHAVDPLIRIGGASGGLCTALVVYALENGIIDAAIVCGQSTTQPWRAVARIATTKQEVCDAAQTKSAVCPNNSLLGEAVRKGYKKLGIVGMPCQIEGIRKMQLLGRPKKIIDSIEFTIGLACGTNKHHKAVEHVIEELCMVPLDQVLNWKRREGAYPGYGTVFTKDGRRVTIAETVRRAFFRAFTKERCTMCRDYLSELADISAGDYFASRMVAGVPGETAVVIRTDAGRKLMEDAEAESYIGTQPAEEKELNWNGWEEKKHANLWRVVEYKKFGRATPNFHWPVDYPIPMHGRESQQVIHPHI